MIASAMFSGWVKEGYRPPDRKPIWEWMEENLRFRDSPYGNRFRISETPWLMEPLSCITDPEVEEAWLCCAAQMGKTTVIQGGVAWSLCESPGPTMIVLDAGDSMKEMAEEKINPVLQNCPPLVGLFPDDRTANKKLKVQFPQATLIMGPANDSFLRSKSIRWQFNDEVSKWQPGNVQRAKARTTRFQNRFKLFASTPLEYGDDFSLGWEGGTQEEWALQCQGCGELFVPEFRKVMVWEENETTKPDGAWDYAEVRKTVRMKCPHCEHLHEHTPENIREMNDGGGYIQQNPEGTKRIRSFRFNVLPLPPSVLHWGDVVEEFLKSTNQVRKGNVVPMRELVTLRFAEFWKEADFMGIDELKLDQYEPSEEWPDEAMRFLTVDCQHNLADFWAVTRAWSLTSESRLLAFRRPKSFDEVEELREELNVPPHRTFIDIGYERAEVLEACARYGWIGLRGEDHESYLHVMRDGKTTIKRWKLHSKLIRERITNLPRSPAIFNWSNSTVKDIANRLKSGRGAEWLVPDLGELTPEYLKQIDSERKREVVNKQTGQTELRWVKFRENHAWDCECMQVVAATIAGLYGSE